MLHVQNMRTYMDTHICTYTIKNAYEYINTNAGAHIHRTLKNILSL